MLSSLNNNLTEFLIKKLIAIGLLNLVTFSAHAGLFSDEMMIHNPSNSLLYDLSIYKGLNDKGGLIWNHHTQKYDSIEMKDLSKEVAEMNGIKKNSIVLILSKQFKQNADIERFCEVKRVFENAKVYATCSYSSEEISAGTPRDERKYSAVFSNLDCAFVAVGVADLEGAKAGDMAILSIDTLNIKAGSKVKILSVLSNDEALIARNSLSNKFTKSSIFYNDRVEKVKISDLGVNR